MNLILIAILLLASLNTILALIIISKLNNLEGKEELEMVTLADIQAEVAAEQEVVKSAVALISGLASQVKNLAPNQEAIDALANSIEAQKNELAEAVAANTTPAPAPTEETQAP